MTQVFNSIAEFIQVRTHCVFCQSPLVPELSNFSGANFKNIPLFTAQLKNDIFEFHLKFSSYETTIDTTGYLNAITGKLEFSEYEYFGDHSHNYPNVEVEIFTSFSPYISLNCENIECKMNYYAASDILKVRLNEHIIKPLTFNWESFNYKKLWVQNDWVNMKTLIYSTNKQDSDPIKNSLIDFKDYDKEKLLTRIHTLVTFS
jgi:hypothetical protein